MWPTVSKLLGIRWGCRGSNWLSTCCMERSSYLEWSVKVVKEMLSCVSCVCRWTGRWDMSSFRRIRLWLGEWETTFF